MRFKKVLRTALTAALISGMVPMSAFAHGVWVETRLDQLTLVLGEGYKDNAYDPKMVTSLKAYDESYKEVSVKKTNYKDHVTIQPNDKAAVIATSFDYGYWSQDPKSLEYKNVPMTELKGSKKGTYALKYSVAYTGPVKEVKEVPGLPYQLIPMTDPSKLSLGDTLQVKVVNNGKPMANTDVILDVVNNPAVMKKTDAKGIVSVPVKNGNTNVIGIELTLPYDQKDGKASQTKVFSSLSFTIRPAEED